jgi:hypothetical protein
MFYYANIIDMSETVHALDLSFLDGNGVTSDCQSHLDAYGDKNWRVNNSSMADYASRARMRRGPNTLMDRLIAQVGRSKENVGLDIAAGSNARALQDLLGSGVIGRALATNYQDCRPNRLKASRRLSHIAGDLADPATWQEIADWKDEHAPEGFAVAMHRPIGGMQGMPEDFYAGAAHAALDMVRPHGFIFTQVPRNLTNPANTFLGELCTGIRERADVAGTITAPPARLGTPIDKADQYVVILKR